jgi:hypothetical protein
MKKLVAGIMGIGLVVGLVGCSNYSDGVDTSFGDKAVAIFAEIDDDTMTMELSDGDDIQNFDLLGVEADSEREVKFVNGLEGMVKLQDKVVSGDRSALKEYLLARKSALNALGVKDNGMTVAEFTFYEEE